MRKSEREEKESWRRGGIRADKMDEAKETARDEGYGRREILGTRDT